MTKILITGGSGLIGRLISQHLLEQGYEIVWLSRNKTSASRIKSFRWDLEQQYVEAGAFKGVEGIIHLAGADIAEKRWSRTRKQEILYSRVKSTELLFKEIKEQEIKLKCFIGISAVGYYGTETSEQLFTEDNLSGNDFLAEVCKQWEECYTAFSECGIRTVILRLGIVLSNAGGAFQKMRKAFGYGLGATLAGGKQYFPWIESGDLCRLIEFALTKDKLAGPFNAVATEIQTNQHFSELLAKHFKKSIVLPSVPECLLRLVFGERALLLSRGLKISNQKILKKGFTFRFENMDACIAHLLAKTHN